MCQALPAGRPDTQLLDPETVDTDGAELGRCVAKSRGERPEGVRLRCVAGEVLVHQRGDRDRIAPSGAGLVERLPQSGASSICCRARQFSSPEADKEAAKR